MFSVKTIYLCTHYIITSSNLENNSLGANDRDSTY